MGFEVKYYYHVSKGVGEYDKENKQEGSIKVGSPYEDVCLDVLAGKILALMARRNILVVGVEIYEMVKKAVNFRETEDGIVVKNKKFKFDDGASIVGELVEESKPAVKTESTSVARTEQLNVPIAKSPSGKIPIRYEFFNPDDWDSKRNSSDLWLIAMRQIPNLKLTMGKKYPIFAEKTMNAGDRAGMFYTTVDDNGRNVTLFSGLFSLVGQNRLEGNLDRPSDVNLNWGGLIKDDMPSLR